MLHQIKLNVKTVELICANNAIDLLKLEIQSHQEIQLNVEIVKRISGEHGKILITLPI